MAFTRKSIQLVVILPDGRTLLTRDCFSSLKPANGNVVWGKWKMSLEIDIPPEVIVAPAMYAENALQNLLGFKITDDEFADDMFEHSIGSLKVFVLLIKFNRSITISTPLTIDSTAMSFEQIAAAVDHNREDFTPDTVRTLNLYDTLVA